MENNFINMKFGVAVVFLWCLIKGENASSLFEYTNEDINNIVNDFKDFTVENSGFRVPGMFLHTYVYDNNRIFKDVNKEILAIDFGGTSLKLCLYKIDGNKIEESSYLKQIKIPNDEKYATVDAFDWVAGEIKNYLPPRNNTIIAGLTFSYPTEQASLHEGRILSLHKNFPFKQLNDGDKNPVSLLNKAIKRKSINVVVKALSNDTTATLMSVPRAEKCFNIGIVLGTGTNAAYFSSKHGNPPEAVNTEWGSFYSKSLKMNKYDKIIKKEIESKDKLWKPLDCLLSGYRFIDLLNLSAKDILSEDFVYNIENVKKIVNKGNKKSKKYQHILKLKKRTAKVLAALTFGILESEAAENYDEINLILNGTIFDQKLDKKLFKKEIKALCMERKKYNYEMFKFLVPKNASLLGMASILANEGDYNTH